MIDLNERRLQMAAAIQAQSAIPYEFLAVPRDRGDEACELLSPIAFKIWYRIVRLTVGWGKEEAIISYSDLMRTCGISHRPHITKAIKEMFQKGFMRIVKGRAKCEPSAYAPLDATGSPYEPRRGLDTGSPVEPPPLTLVHQLNHKPLDTGSPVEPVGGSPVEPAKSRQAALVAAPHDPIEIRIETSNKDVSIRNEKEKREKDVAPASRGESPWGGLSPRERVIQECGGMAAISALHSQSREYENIIAALMATGDTDEEEEPTPLRHTPPVCNDERIMGAWVQVKQTIKTHMGEATYKGLIETAHPVGLKGNIFTVWTCSALLLKRWAGLITEQLRKVLNDRTILVSFEAPAIGGA